MRFVLGGVERELDAETVRKVAEQHAPNPIDGRHKYYVDIGGLRYPVNQLFGLATGMRPDEFITDDANRLLSKLGFVIEKFRRPTALPIQAKGIDSQQSYRERESENSVSFAVSPRIGRRWVYRSKLSPVAGMPFAGPVTSRGG